MLSATAMTDGGTISGAIGGGALAGEDLRTFFERDAIAVARDLLGCNLSVDGAGGRITETEAYFPDDEASHSFRGPTKRNGAMFGRPGNVYIYRIYGMYWCLNFVCHPGSAVLIRALEPEAGIPAMMERRGTEMLTALCSGPGKLCQALGIDIAINDRLLDRAPYALTPSAPVPIVAGKRIGITKNAEAPWRFGIQGSRYLSKPFR
ncbi:DNA-3-methyladenine glycosylase [Rhizobium lentis]|uniref:Putative 3-methyladenine DNA glycosylase n=1 Tax=Rhizobium lentis TaxID=1138194 RepID=A0A9Q3R329_9HYPH|nr:DNA-3-methyladenine glycosylase [Rhizobium lentis]MBX4959201.1 DNA-3-methyladenine glycosylase [Rhizobium lentis]MBX4977220.1 DNA-3-methyladenine glycosylase [Rhizobium lentis]MBX4989207.1 DNA-3-methyladenine glycosylase [Rhizobium lentis]MBX5007699.1 DNA-3-methyladenine glycosylase [Rhizobium lentis]MBX5013550.1 DNA-3-methyladenine glycosylase [Rhizobium lentis]